MSLMPDAHADRAASQFRRENFGQPSGPLRAPRYPPLFNLSAMSR